MNLRRALFIAAIVLLPAAAVPAVAQLQPNPFDRPPAASPFYQPPQQQQEPPCMKDFVVLRDKAEKLAGEVMAAQKRKVPLSEACRLLTAFAVSQDKLLIFAKTKQVSCGIPQQLIQNISTGHANVVKARTNVCNMAAQPQRPAGPSLSDALGGGIPDPSNIKTARGTFDPLTGTPLGNTAKGASRPDALPIRPAIGSTASRLPPPAPICGSRVSTGRSDPGCC